MTLEQAVESTKTEMWAIINKLANDGYSSTLTQLNDAIKVGELGNNLKVLYKARSIITHIQYNNSKTSKS